MAVQTKTAASDASVPTVYKKGRLQKLGVSGVMLEVGKYVLLIVLAVSFVFPFYWMITSALKDDPQV